MKTMIRSLILKNVSRKKFDETVELLKKRYKYKRVISPLYMDYLVAYELGLIESAGCASTEKIDLVYYFIKKNPGVTISEIKEFYSRDKECLLESRYDFDGEQVDNILDYLVSRDEIDVSESMTYTVV
uniref:Uncharacterized protein n=1 Tax=Methanococcus maripaludis (strain C6 / ATCC BAA-1332) TaxID=444158 RepID=A9A6U3_METM6